MFEWCIGFHLHELQYHLHACDRLSKVYPDNLSSHKLLINLSIYEFG